MPVLGNPTGTEVFRSTIDYPDSRTFPGLLALGFDAGLFFVDSDALNDRLRGLAHQADPPYRVVILDFEGVNYIDSQGSQSLGEIITLVTAHGAQLRLARAKPDVLSVLEADGILDRIGQDNIHGTVYEAARDMIPADAHGG
jgi:SulP family sulfate permease